MNRDSLLALVLGLMLGFVAAYLGFEWVGQDQPARIAPGSAPADGGAVSQTQAEAQAQAQAAAMQEFERLRQEVAANPDDPGRVVALANIYFDLQDWSRALELYERYVELRPSAPDVADVLSDIGICQRELGRFQEALGAFDRAGELNPGHWQSRFNKVVVQAFDLQDYDGAEATIEELRRLQPGNPEVDRLAQEVARLRGAA